MLDLRRLLLTQEPAISEPKYEFHLRWSFFFSRLPIIPPRPCSQWLAELFEASGSLLCFGMQVPGGSLPAPASVRDLDVPLPPPAYCFAAFVMLWAPYWQEQLPLVWFEIFIKKRFLQDWLLLFLLLASRNTALTKLDVSHIRDNIIHVFLSLGKHARRWFNLSCFLHYILYTLRRSFGVLGFWDWYCDFGWR